MGVANDFLTTQGGTNEPDNFNAMEEFNRMLVRDEDRIPRATEWLIEGFIPEGHTVIAGGAGAGKSTTMTTLVAVIAGIAKAENIQAKRPRTVVWFTEDYEQIDRMSTVLDYSDGHSVDNFRERVRLVKAKRFSGERLAELTKAAVEQFTVDGQAPVIIYDTLAATLDIGDTSAASQVSTELSHLRQLDDVSWILIGHTPKAGSGQELAGSVQFTGDTQAALYLQRNEEVTEASDTVPSALLLQRKMRSGVRYTSVSVFYQGTVVLELEDSDGVTVPEWIDKVRLVANDKETTERLKRSTGSGSKEPTLLEQRTWAVEQAMTDNPEMDKKALSAHLRGHTAFLSDDERMSDDSYRKAFNRAFDKANRTDKQDTDCPDTDGGAL